MNKNNQTTSTKCQYHAAASNPKCWFAVKSQNRRSSRGGNMLNLIEHKTFLAQHNNNSEVPTRT